MKIILKVLAWLFGWTLFGAGFPYFIYIDRIQHGYPDAEKTFGDMLAVSLLFFMLTSFVFGSYIVYEYEIWKKNRGRTND